MSTGSESGQNLVGVDLSAPNACASLVSGSGRVIERLEYALEPNNIIEQVGKIVADLRTLEPNISAIGVAVRGLVNRESDQVIASRDLPTIVRKDLHSELVRATGLRVEIENDANAAAYGEFKVGAGHGSRDMFYITIGEGIGGAIILDGKLWTGSSGFAGEFGHITIDPEGMLCECGNTGCLETIASAPNIVRRAKERLYRDSTSSLSRLAINKKFTANDVVHEAKNGDDFCVMMLERTGRFIGNAVASVINLLNIERIVLGGGVMEAGALILDPIIREANRRAFHPSFEATKIVAATLGTDAVPIGAALLAGDARH